MDDVFVFSIAQLAVKAVLSVAAAYPKPGLVTPLDDGPDGADFQTAMDGALALLPCCINCASIGGETADLGPEDVMTLLRPAGKHGERDVLGATQGLRAHRGAVFFMGLLCAAAGRLCAQEMDLNPRALTLTASSFARGIVEKHLGRLASGKPEADRERTQGERAYLACGLKGARGEAELGFGLTLRTASLLKELEPRLPMRERLAHALLFVLSENEDTALWSGDRGSGGLSLVRETARAALEAGGMMSSAGREAIAAMDRSLRERALAPRGGANVLSAALFALKARSRGKANRGTAR